MKITYLVPNIDGMGGTSRAVLTQAEALCGRHEIEILSVVRSAKQPHYDIPAGVTVRYLSSAVPDEQVQSAPPSLVAPDVAETLQRRPSLLVPKHWDPTLTALGDTGLERHLPQVRGDVLVTVTPGLLAAAAQLAPDSIALVHQEHRASSQRTAGLEPLLVFGPRADAIALLTHPTADWLRAQLGDAAPSLEVVPNALPPGYRPRSTLENPLIVSGGRFAQEKQFSHLIRAFGQIADQIPDWRLRIYGSGPNRPRMVKVIRKARLFDRVELPGVSNNMAIEWANSSVAALTSVTEGLPLIVQEAMAAGVPVASYDCPEGPRELIEHETNGLLVPPGSESGMASALLRLATDHDARRRMGSAALESSARFEPDQVVPQWESLFARAIDSHASHRRTPRTTRRAVSLATSRPAAATTTERRPTPAPLPPQQARQQTMEWVTKAARSASDRWFVIPEGFSSTPVLVLSDVDRERFFRALAEGSPDFLSLRRPESSGWPERRGDVATMAGEMTRTVADRVVVEPWPGPAQRPGLLSRGCSVSIEFWVTRSDNLVPLHGSPLSRPVSASAPLAHRTVWEVEVPTLQNMSRPTVDQCDFPIDAVVTWVDGDDEAWAQAREQRLAVVTGEAPDRTASGRARFADNGELRYALRSIDLFAPWIRTIHLVTAGQAPAWLDHEHPRIQLVDHTDILPSDALPTFNSHAIETALHRTPGLTEQYLYFNDDVFLGRPARPESFFSPDGSPAFFRSKESIGPEDPDAPAYLQAAYNNRRLLADDFGRSITHTLAHTPHPQRRSLVSEVVERYAKVVQATARAPFRSPEDVSLTSSLAQHYGLLTGGAWPGEIGHRLVSRSSPGLRTELQILMQREMETFCISDHHDYAIAKQHVDDMMTAFFEEYFPFPADWELDR